jgi:chromosome segregation ATPase
LDEYYTQLDVVVEKYTRTKEHLTKLKQRCKKLKASIKSFSNSYDEDEEKDGDDDYREEDIDVLKQSIDELKKSVGLIEHYKHTKSKLSDSIRTRTHKYTIYNKELDDITNTLHTSKTVSDDELDTLNTQMNQLRNDMDILRKYELYETSYQLHKKYTDKKQSLETDISEYEQLLSTAMRFKEKIVEAETIALTNLIQTINTNVQLYLDSFFEKEPLSASISSVKQTKNSKKSEIGIDIQYKGNPFNLQSLSGGERDRLILAFTLTLSELNNTPILLLDECVSSLDQENADLVFTCIKNYCHNKLTILIAHQIVTGMFDEIIRL